ncbi:MAG: MFS transporter, partial [Phycisphaerales bacterium]|nr:MFS transporter [Phycisphaerales bacterium]
IGGGIATLYGERFGALLGTALQALGLLFVGLGAAWESMSLLALALLLQGVGHGFALPPMTSIIATAVKPADFGTASGVHRLSGQIGSSFGLSMFGVLLSTGNGDIDPFRLFALGAFITLLAALPAIFVRSQNNANIKRV